MNLNEAVQDLGTMLADTGLNVYSVILSGDTPAIVIQPPTDIRYHQTFSGRCEVDIKAAVYLNATDEASAFTLLYNLLNINAGGNTSIPDALIGRYSSSIKEVHIIRAGGFRYNEDTNTLTADINLTLYL